MSENTGGWVHLQLTPAAYANFGVEPVPIPIRVDVLLGFPSDGFQLSPELMAREIVAYLEERLDEYEIYRPLLGELAYNVGTELAMAGDAEGAVSWLERSARARPRDLSVLGNYAKALARCVRPAEALEVCAIARTLSPDLRARLFFASVEKECRATIAVLGNDPAADDGLRP